MDKAAIALGLFGGHGWVHHLAECFEGHLTVGDPQSGHSR